MGICGASWSTIDPGHRFFVERADLVITDFPIQRVLERARKTARIFRCREQNRIRGPDRVTQELDREISRRPVVIGIEVREIGDTRIGAECQ